MKAKLIFISLSPVFLLTAILNIQFLFFDNAGQPLSLSDFICSNLLVLIILFVCVVWLLLSVWCYVNFKYMMSFDKNGGYSIHNVKEEKDAGLNYFLAIIMPLLLSDLNRWQNAIAFLVTLILIFVLLYKTNLYYQNPILTILDYHIYHFEFKENKERTGEYIAIAVGKLSKDEYKEIGGEKDNVLFAKKNMKVMKD